MATIAAYGDTAWNTAGTSFTATSVSWSTGDLVLVICGIEDAGATINAPTVSGLSFSQVDANTAASTANAKSFQATAGSSGSGGVNFTTSVSKQGGISVWVISGSSGVGDHKEQHTATKTVASTKSAGGPSIYVWCCLDFSGDGVGSGTPTPSNTRRAVAGNSDYLVCDLTGVTTNQSYGEGATGGSAGPFTLLVIEAKDAGAAGGYQSGRPLLPRLHFFGELYSPRFGFQGTIAAPVVSAVFDSLTIGGAIASGFGPVALVSVTQGGAVAGGFAPTASSTAPQGGATAAGFGPTALVPVTQGGAVAGGFSPTDAPGDTVPAGGATAGGFGPTAKVSLTIGGAIAAGFSPTSSASTTIGGAVGSGFGPTARVTLTIGGGTAGGNPPSDQTFVPGGALVGGFGPTAKVSETIGGATAGGFSPFASPSSTIGGASSGGFPATVRVSLFIGGALAGGFPPAEPPPAVPLPPILSSQRSAIGSRVTGGVGVAGAGRIGATATGGLTSAQRGRMASE